MNPHTEQERAAEHAETIRTIRALAQRALDEDRSAGLPGGGHRQVARCRAYHTMLAVLTRLRPGRPEEAVDGWRAVSRRLAEDLRTGGVTFGKCLGPLLDELFDYLESEGWRYDTEVRPRHWRPWEETREGQIVTAMWAARKAKAAESAPPA